jgi:toxin-antitoxin system PIN domain toxin
MILPDANLLIYSVNLDSAFHPAALSWWKKALAGREPIGLCPPVVFAFIRLATHQRNLVGSLSVDEAFGYVENWLAYPSVSWIEPQSGYLELIKELLQQAGTGGNLVTDAQIAAIALHHGATVYTSDVDFARFPGLKWRNPLVSSK